MTIIDELKRRSDNPSDEVKIELKLYTLADDLEKKARAHLKRITNILPEFDIHDEKHSEKVIFNIEQLLGNEKIKELSYYELFFLYLSSYFHDAAMAPSDWEINTLMLIPKKTKFETISDKFIVDIQEKLNHRPRKILGYKTPHEVFFAKIAQWIDDSKLHYKNNVVALDC